MTRQTDSAYSGRHRKKRLASGSQRVEVVLDAEAAAALARLEAEHGTKAAAITHALLAADAETHPAAP